MRFTFTDLSHSDPDLTPGQQQQRAAELFPSAVEGSHMEVWQPGDPWPPIGDAVIWIAVATWSLYDLKLLDLLETNPSRGSRKERIYLFNTVGFPKFDFEERLPDIGKIFHTPIVVSWTGGILEESLSGALARDWLIKRFGLSRD